MAATLAPGQARRSTCDAFLASLLWAAKMWAARRLSSGRRAALWATRRLSFKQSLYSLINFVVYSLINLVRTRRSWCRQGPVVQGRSGPRRYHRLLGRLVLGRRRLRKRHRARMVLAFWRTGRQSSMHLDRANGGTTLNHTDSVRSHALNAAVDSNSAPPTPPPTPPRHPLPQQPESAQVLIPFLPSPLLDVHRASALLFPTLRPSTNLDD